MYDENAMEPLSKMTVLELTRLISAQDSRWGDILTYAQSTHHPRAQQGITFFKRTWRPVMGDYFENVVNRYDSTAKAPNSVVRTVLDKMANVVYPAARSAGFSEQSFLIPDITIDKGYQAAPVAGHPSNLWLGIDPRRHRRRKAAAKHAAQLEQCGEIAEGAEGEEQKPPSEAPAPINKTLLPAIVIIGIGIVGAGFVAIRRLGT